MIRKITIREIGMPEAMFKGKDAFGKKIVKPVLKQLIKIWHQKYMPRHFERSASFKYGYRPRTWQHQRRKYFLNRVIGRTPMPLVFTGRLKIEVSQNIRVVGTKQGAKGTVRGPRYLYRYSKGGARPHLAGELTKVTTNEIEEQLKWVERETLKRINWDKTKSVVKIRA
jgi:hypothetical protein